MDALHSLNAKLDGIIQFTSASSMLRDLNKRGIKLIRADFADGRGFFDPRKKTITVSKRAKSPLMTFWHESGHAVAPQDQLEALEKKAVRHNTAEWGATLKLRRAREKEQHAESMNALRELGLKLGMKGERVNMPIPSSAHLEKRKEQINSILDNPFNSLERAGRKEEIAANHRAIGEMQSRGASPEFIKKYRSHAAAKLNTYRAGY